MKKSDTKRRAPFSLIDPRLQERGLNDGPSKTETSFADKKNLCRLYGRSSNSNFARPLTPQEIGIVHLSVQHQVMREEVIREMRSLLSLSPPHFYRPEIIGDQTLVDSRFSACLENFDNPEMLETILPEAFAGHTNKHHIIPKSLNKEFETGKKFNNVISLNETFHTDHWHSLYLNRDPLKIERMLYIEIGLIDILSQEVREKLGNILIEKPDFYKPELIKLSKTARKKARKKKL